MVSSLASNHNNFKNCCWINLGTGNIKNELLTLCMAFQIKDIPKAHSTFKSKVWWIIIQLTFEDIHIKIIRKRLCNINVINTAISDFLFWLAKYLLTSEKKNPIFRLR